ncbi:MAG: HlyC/CorC family transporter [Burkholderiaceae bacterium]
MDTLPLWAQILILVGLLAVAGFFSIAETSMMAINRFRLRHLAKQGNRAAIRTQELLEQTERLLGVILIGNNVINTISAMFSGAIAAHYWGNNQYALSIAAALISFAIIIFSELTPKVIGAAYPEKIALPASLILKPLLTIIYPAVWFTNLFANGLLRLMRINPKPDEETLSSEEIRALVLEQTPLMPKKHKSILVNLFDLEEVEVNDLMTPRSKIEALNINDDIDTIRHQLVTCYHNKLPVYDGELNNILGIFHIRKALHHLEDGSLTIDEIRNSVSKPYFIPSETAIFEQLQHFQEDKQRLGVVVDEYSEVLGILTMEDIIEEMVGEFTSAGHGGQSRTVWGEDGSVVIDAGTSLREVNRRLKLNLPLDGPKTLNGLILEELQDIPDAQVSLRFNDCVVEVVHVDDQGVRSARLFRLNKQKKTSH